MSKIEKLEKAIEAFKKIDSENFFEKEETTEEKELFEVIKEFNLRSDKQLKSIFETICDSDLLESTKRAILSMIDDYLDMNFIKSSVRDEMNNYIIH